MARKPVTPFRKQGTPWGKSGTPFFNKMEVFLKPGYPFRKQGSFCINLVAMGTLFWKPCIHYGRPFFRFLATLAGVSRSRNIICPSYLISIVKNNSKKKHLCSLISLCCLRLFAVVFAYSHWLQRNLIPSCLDSLCFLRLSVIS